MIRSVAVVGAGPSGLAAAKAALECGLRPTVFETGRSLAGLWRDKDGFVWQRMRTNISKWNCVFSDFPWHSDAEEFPLAADVDAYLRAYAQHFELEGHIEYGRQVAQAARTEDGWMLSFDGQPDRQFDSVIVASGVFARPFIPDIPGLKQFAGVVSHAAHFARHIPSSLRIAVIGASFTGVEIACDLAARKVPSTLVIDRPFWVLPRYAKVSGCAEAPLDLIVSRHRRTQGPFLGVVPLVKTDFSSG